MKNYLQIVLIVLFAVLYFNQCRITAHNEGVAEKNELAKKDTISYFQNKLKQTVAEKKTFKGTATQLKTYLDTEKQKSTQFAEASKKWKKLYNASIIKVEFKAKDVDIPFDEKVSINFVRKFSKKTKTYTFSGSVNEFGIKLDALAMATLTPMTGIKPVGLFKNEHRTEITSSNKLIKVTDFSNFTFVEKPKKWGIGVSFGVGVYNSGFFVGPSVNYNFIRF
jgi:hypothetical protein